MSRSSAGTLHHIALVVVCLHDFALHRCNLIWCERSEEWRQAEEPSLLLNRAMKAGIEVNLGESGSLCGPRLTFRKYRQRKAKTQNTRPLNDRVLRLGGSDGGRFRMVELFAPRKVKLQAIRIDNELVSVTPSKRYMQRPRKLTPAEEHSMRALAHTKSYRSLAADFGVSHETVRSIIQKRDVRR